MADYRMAAAQLREQQVNVSKITWLKLIDFLKCCLFHDANIRNNPYIYDILLFHLWLFMKIEALVMVIFWLF